MDYLADHQHMLKLAASDELPREINEDGPLSVAVCRELYEAGLIDAADARTFDGDCFLQPRITIPGREYLNALEARAAEVSPSGRAKRFGGIVGGWIGGILTGVVIAWILWRLGLPR